MNHLTNALAISAAIVLAASIADVALFDAPLRHLAPALAAAAVTSALALFVYTERA